jgi:hypothetical protein
MIFWHFPKQLMASRKSNKLYWKKHENMTYISKPRSANSPKIEYLGLVVEEGKLAMDSSKLKGILDWPAPKTS